MRILSISFVVALALIVTATIGLGWELDKAEISVVALFVLLGTILVNKIISKSKKEGQDAKIKSTED